MIVVFVVDTSPTMARPAVGDSGMSRLDVAKMVVEDLVSGLRKRRAEQYRILQEAAAAAADENNLTTTSRSWTNLGLSTVGGNDALLLLSTSRQHPDTAACAAGGRLLVGFGSNNKPAGVDSNSSPSQTQSGAGAGATAENNEKQQRDHLETFQRELKGLQAARWDPNNNNNNSNNGNENKPFPEGGGGAAGLNVALSAGLQLLSRYRLQHRITENFGMGRLPSTAFVTANGNPATAALQPATLILITDGACLRSSPEKGGGPLELSFGNQPLREFYKEPFRWDQKIYCLGVGAPPSMTSSQFFHPRLRSMCEVTGGAHWLVRETGSMHGVTNSLLRRMSPPLPPKLPMADPLYQHPRLNAAPAAIVASTTTAAIVAPSGSSFVSGGPICCFQALESDDPNRRTPPVQLRAMLLYTGSPATNTSTGAMQQQQNPNVVPSPPLWCIPEAHFPSKKLDSLPQRHAQPLLLFSKHPSNLGSKSFEPLQLIRMLHRLDQLVLANRKLLNATGAHASSKPLLHRDVYICEWLSPNESTSSIQTALKSITRQTEYVPVFVPGAGRPSLNEDAENYLNIGILHIPTNSKTLSFSSSMPTGEVGPSLATLTLLPPEPHILLPVLLRAADIENRLLRKQSESSKAAGGATSGSKSANVVVHLDNHWRSEFRAYLFRLPPYYQHAIKRSLRPILPASAHSLLMTEGGMESLAIQCFSKNCLQKIRNGEQIARDNNERLERQEISLRRKDFTMVDPQEKQVPVRLRYGQFDPRSSVDSYLAALRNMPPPWRQRNNADDKGEKDGRNGTASMVSENKEKDAQSPRTVVDVLGDLPAECLMAYYESRRRWIFGGSGHSTRGSFCAGVNNDGSNSQQYHTKPGDPKDESLLSIAGIGVSRLNKTSTSKMGDYRERILFSRSPVVGTGSNDAAGVAITTAVDGSPVWSVDDNALPITFFDPRTGEFADSVEARVKSRLLVNFGNPYKERRADSLIPEKWLSQAPSMQQVSGVSGTVTSGSPPHDSFDSVEEGEAVFVRKSPSRSSPKREEPEDPTSPSPAKKAKTDDYSSPGSNEAKKALSESSTESRKAPTPVASNKVTPPPLPTHSRRSSLPRPPNAPPAPPKAPPPPSLTPPAHANAPGRHSKKPPQPPNTQKSRSSGKLPPPPPPRPPTSKSIVHRPPTTNATLHRPSVTAPPAPPPPKHSAPPPPPKHPRQAQNARAPGPSSAKTTITPAPLSAKLTSVPPPQNEWESEVKHPQQSASSHDLQNADVKPAVDLPDGWMSVWSKSQKRWYFFDTTTNRSVWQWPPQS